MDISEQLPILLKVELDGDKINLRLDEKGLGYFEKSDESIREISLNECEADEKLIEALEESVNQVFEYEIVSEDGKRVFQYWADYGRITDEIKCQSVSESVLGYTETDLVQKGKILFDLYSDLLKRFIKNSAINVQTSNKLKFEISNEIERFQRKAEFFSEKNKNKSEVFQSEIKVFQKLLRILARNDLD